jgi:threonyl-tRNA synthetase
MIHHAVFGSIGRFIAMLLEHHAGALPFWLSPDQVAVAPVSHDHSDYATKVLDVLEAEGVRGVLLASAETLSRRIVAAHEASVPVVAVVGQREAEQGTVSVRERTGTVSVLPLHDAVMALRQRARPGQVLD